MTTPAEGDTVRPPRGRLWRVTVVRGEIVQAEEVDARIVSRFYADELTVVEEHLGGAR